MSKKDKRATTMAPGAKTPYDAEEIDSTRLYHGPGESVRPGIFSGPDGENAMVAAVMIGTALFAVALCARRAPEAVTLPEEMDAILSQAEDWATRLVKRFSGG